MKCFIFEFLRLSRALVCHFCLLRFFHLKNAILRDKDGSKEVNNFPAIAYITKAAGWSGKGNRVRKT